MWFTLCGSINDCCSVHRSERRAQQQHPVTMRWLTTRGSILRIIAVILLSSILLSVVFYFSRRNAVLHQRLLIAAEDGMSVYEEMRYTTLRTVDGSLTTAAKTFTVTKEMLEDIGFPVTNEHMTLLNNRRVFSYVFVTAMNRDSSGQCLNAISTIQRYFRSYKVYVYDLDDATSSETKEQLSKCDIVYRKFEFNRYPPHVRNVNNHAYKPLIIHELLREHINLIWIDPTVQFINSASMEVLQNKVLNPSSDMLIFRQRTLAIPNTTRLSTFEYIPRSTVSTSTAVDIAKLIYVNSSPTLYMSVLRWWLFCALQPDCIDASTDRRCHGDDDVSCYTANDVTLSVLLSNFYNGDISKYGFTENNFVEMSDVSNRKERLLTCLQNGTVVEMKPRRPLSYQFHVVSNFTGLVLDIENSDKKSGTPIIIYGRFKPPSANQLWYFDDKGHLRSFFNNLTIEADVGRLATVEQFSDKTSQNWLAHSGRIVNRATGKCLHVDDDKIHVTVNVCRPGSFRQRWSIEYL